MKIPRSNFFLAPLLGISFLLSGCAGVHRAPGFDYTAFRESRPRSILILPPVNHSPEVKASASFLATTTIPLAESGYYVIPVTLSEETFKQNGVLVAEDAQAIHPDKLREIFGADSALYITIERFGTRYQVINSVVEASASGKLVDLRSGLELWHGSARIVLGNNNNGGNLIGALVGALIDQIANSISDKSHDAARLANYGMLRAGYKDSILYGPYHPKFGTD